MARKRKGLLVDRNLSGIQDQYLGDPVSVDVADDSDVIPDLTSRPRTEQTAGAPAGEDAPTPEASSEAATEPAARPSPGPEPEVANWPVTQPPQPSGAAVADGTPASPRDAEEGTGREPEQQDEPEAVLDPVVVPASAASKSAEGSDSVPPTAPELADSAPEPITLPAGAPAGEGSAMSAAVIEQEVVPPSRAVASAASVKGLERYGDQRNRSRALTQRVGLSIPEVAMDEARSAHMSDKDQLPVEEAPPSLVMWIQRAVHLHLARTPAQRKEAATRHPFKDDGSRKTGYNVPLPFDMKQQLEAAIIAERKAGRSTSNSGLIREAMAIEAAAARARAGGQLPVWEGKLPHAR